MKYRPEIDGLRCIAVIPVVFFHAGVPWLDGGFVGVDIFFVISGYLITSIILIEERKGEFSIARFYERRARRILPVLFVVMLICIPFAWEWMLPLDMKGFSASVAAVAVYCSNFLFFKTSNYFDSASELKPLLHTWSLAVEEQYYIIFPLSAVLLMRWKSQASLAAIIVVALSSLAAAEWYSTHNVPFAYFLLPTRAWELMVGAMVSLWIFRRNGLHDLIRQETAVSSAKLASAGSVAGLIAIAASYFVFNARTPYPSVYTTLPVAGAACVVLFASAHNMVGKALASRPMVGVGLVSYGIYVWHQPLIAMVRLRSVGAPNAYLLVGVAALSIPLAWLTRVLVESPMRQRRWIGRRNFWLLISFCTLCFLIFGLAGYKSGGFPDRLPVLVVKLSEMKGEYFGLRDDAGCNLTGADERLLGCMKGDLSKAPNIALIGDSQAASLAHALGAGLLPYHRRFVQYTKTGCFPHPESTEIFDYNCKNYLWAATRDALLRNLDTFVFYSVWWVAVESGVSPHDVENSSVFQTYREIIQELLKRGKKVIVIYPTPDPGFNVPNHVAKKILFHVPADAYDDIDANFFSWQSHNSYVALDSLGNAAGLVRVYPEHIFCNTYRLGRCVITVNEALMYGDHRHLSEDGAKLLAHDVVTKAALY